MRQRRWHPAAVPAAIRACLCCIFSLFHELVFIGSNPCKNVPFVLRGMRSAAAPCMRRRHRPQQAQQQVSLAGRRPIVPSTRLSVTSSPPRRQCTARDQNGDRRSQQRCRRSDPVSGLRCMSGARSCEHPGTWASRSRGPTLARVRAPRGRPSASQLWRIAPEGRPRAARRNLHMPPLPPGVYAAWALLPPALPHGKPGRTHLARMGQHCAHPPTAPQVAHCCAP